MLLFLTVVAVGLFAAGMSTGLWLAPRVDRDRDAIDHMARRDWVRR